MANVLIIDDDKNFIETSVELLKRSSHIVSVGKNGQVGLEVLMQDTSIDIIFLDYNMPIMDGYKFLNEIRTNTQYSKYRTIPIIGIGSFPEDKREGLMKCIDKTLFSDEYQKCIDMYCK